ncbi:MAG: hypothetical protein R3E97_24655, partial [Candidatus Eisenbacteria bacterium]
LCGPVATTAAAGPNSAGTLILHAVRADELSTDPDTCGTVPLAACASATVSTDEFEILIVYVLVAFPEGAEPRLSGVTFGIEYPEQVSVFSWETCGDFDLGTATWPSSGSGTATTWVSAKTDPLVTVGALSVLADENATAQLSLTSHPLHGATLADDSVPSNVDPIRTLGALGFGTDGVLPCPVPDGACCHFDGSCEVTLESECTGIGDRWAGEFVSCDAAACPPPPQGACCEPDDDCVVRSEASCLERGGTYQGDSTECGPGPCDPQPTGACCSWLGLCELRTESDCGYSGGTFFGLDSVCEPGPCVTGPCCFDDSCVMATEEGCGSYGGIFRSEDTSCEPNPCADGACCYDDEICRFLSMAQCDALSGVFLGTGIVCGPGICADSPGACCVANGDCRLLLESECEQEGGYYVLPDEPCAPDPCAFRDECGWNETLGEWVERIRQVRATQRGLEGRGPEAQLPEVLGGSVPPGVQGDCGSVLFNADGTF